MGPANGPRDRQPIDLLLGVSVLISECVTLIGDSRPVTNIWRTQSTACPHSCFPDFNLYLACHDFYFCVSPFYGFIFHCRENSVHKLRLLMRKIFVSCAADCIVIRPVATVEFYLYPTVGTVLIHSVKPELTE